MASSIPQCDWDWVLLPAIMNSAATNSVPIVRIIKVPQHAFQRGSTAPDVLAYPQAPQTRFIPLPGTEGSFRLMGYTPPSLFPIQLARLSRAKMARLDYGAAFPVDKMITVLVNNGDDRGDIVVLFIDVGGARLVASDIIRFLHTFAKTRITYDPRVMIHSPTLGLSLLDNATHVWSVDEGTLVHPPTVLLGRLPL
ncbi:unnamed protein product [Mycena citricolor]|uniref:Uncharacterized protein n=1 Tax=Mycena citricolor TaxID=2018698 RepID=A0AAD2HEC6_9AGAR|nr:unnamed protein product [Mycena citricolor]